MVKTSMNLEENIAGVLCYLLFWLTGLIFILIEKKNKTVKFHAWQSFLVFLPLWIIAFVFTWIPFFGWIVAGILWLLVVILWIVLMVKAYQGEKFKLPVIGDIAEKQA